MKNRIGLIAEDNSDVEVMKELMRKIAGDRQFSTKKFVGNGCGKIKGKCVQWAQSLKAQQCSSIILLHDLDERNLTDFSSDLKKTFSSCPIKDNIIIIPVKEIEAWLLSDESAIQRALNLTQSITRIGQPEMIQNPKEKLKEIVYLKSGKTKRYVNTVHNQKIAAEISLENIRRCESFLPLEQFIHSKLK